MFAGLFAIPSKLEKATDLLMPSHPIESDQRTLSWIEEILAHQPETSPYPRMLRLVLLSDAQPTETTAELQELLVRYPECPELLFILGLSIVPNRELAISYHQRALQLRPEFASACFYIGINYAEAGERKTALAYIERALALDPDHLLALWQLGNYHVAEGHSAEARQYYEKIVRLAPDSKLAEQRNLSTSLRHRVHEFTEQRPCMPSPR